MFIFCFPIHLLYSLLNNDFHFSDNRSHPIASLRLSGFIGLLRMNFLKQAQINLGYTVDKLLVLFIKIDFPA